MLLARSFLVAATVLLLACSTARAEDAPDALWRYYPPVKISLPSPNRPMSSPHVVLDNYAPESDDDTVASNDSTYRPSSSHGDPLFDSNGLPSFRRQEIQKPMIERPTYDRPNYDAPLYRVEPVNKVVEAPPEYVQPEIGIKPSYTMTYEQGPAMIAPTLAAPDYRGPNYDIEPINPPAINAPTVDRSGIDYHPENVRPPVYQPEEYQPATQLPPQYQPPPEG